MNALKIILLQYRQYHKLDLIFYWQIFSLHFLFFSFWFFHRWSSGAFSPIDPAPWKGKVPPSASSAPDFLVSPTSGGFRSGGPLALAQILPEEKRHSPERVLETTQGSSRQFSVRMTASTVRSSDQSSFLFLERTYTGSPSEYKRLPPTGEKPQDPWGPSWPGLGSSRDESRPCLEHWKTPESNWRL